MKSKILWTVAALITFCVFLIAKLPASQVIGRLPLANKITFEKVEGTLWDGSAQQVYIQSFPVRDVSWDINPWALLIGRVSAYVSGGNQRNADEVSFDGPLSVSALNPNKISASGFILFVPADRVIANVQLPIPVDMGGRFRVRIDELAMSPQCEELSGFGDWMNATVAGTQGPIDFGNYTAKLSCHDGNINASLVEPNLLGLNLNATIDPSSMKTTVQGRFKVDPSLPKEVHDAASFFGRPNADGYTEFKL